jgi:hypothetical protein
VKLKQEKSCSACGKEVHSGECSRKIVKVGKEEYLVKADDIDKALEAMEAQEELLLHTFVKEIPQDINDRIDGVEYIVPAEKKTKEYRELQEILQGRYAIGKVVIRSNEYEVIVSVGADGIIRMEKLVEQSQLYDVPSIDAVATAEVSKEIISLECSLIDKRMQSDYDFTAFKDTRSKVEEDIIEQVVKSGEVPQAVVKQVEVKQDNDEVARLKALLGE